MGFGARLAEERKRLGFRQAEFADLVGTDVPKQSLYENDRRQLKAAYLSRLAPVGVDVRYVVTGRRSEGGMLGDEATAMLSTFLGLPDEIQETVARLLEDLAGYVEQAQRPTAAEDS